MSSRHVLDTKATSLMIMLCLIWGVQQVAIKAAAGDMSPIMQISLRSGIAALLVASLIRLKTGRVLPSDDSWRPGLVAGFLFALEYLFVGEGLRFTTASHMVVFLYTSPIFAALGLHLLLPEERLKPLQWGGIAVAFLGIIITFLGREESSAKAAADLLKGDLLGLAGGLAWGLTTVVVRGTRLAHTPSNITVLYQLIVAFVILLIASIFLNQTEVTLTRTVWLSLLFQVLIMSFASLLVWFWLLRHYLASRLGVLAFLTPMFGVAFGVIILNEPLETNFLVGGVLVLIGILLVSGYEWLEHRRQKLTVDLEPRQT